MKNIKFILPIFLVLAISSSVVSAMDYSGDRAAALAKLLSQFSPEEVNRAEKLALLERDLSALPQATAPWAEQGAALSWQDQGQSSKPSWML